MTTDRTDKAPSASGEPHGCGCGSRGEEAKKPAATAEEARRAPGRAADAAAPAEPRTRGCC